MQTEKEYLFEVWQTQDAIHRTKDRSRKHDMKRHLHGTLYPKKYLYAFATIGEVQKSISLLRSGKPDPTRPLRYRRLERTIKAMQKILGAYEKEQQPVQEKRTEFKLSLSYNRMKDGRAPDRDLTRE